MSDLTNKAVHCGKTPEDHEKMNSCYTLQTPSHSVQTADAFCDACLLLICMELLGFGHRVIVPM